jgi:uncharacterized protein DUF6522
VGRPNNEGANAVRVEIKDGAFCVDATVLGPLLKLAPADIPGLMKGGSITSICEQGVDEDVGRFRLTFFFGSRRARVNLDAGGNILRRSSIDLGEKAQPHAAQSLR